jgi:hypothetical protein
MQPESALGPPATHPFREALVAHDFPAMREAMNPDIREFTVFFRPLAATTVLASALGKGLARRRSRTRSWLVGVASAPMIVLSRASDRLAPRLVK